MSDVTIYSEKIWKRILEKYPSIKELAIKLGIENNLDSAKGIRKRYNHNFDSPDLNDDKKELAFRLLTVEFRKVFLLKQIVAT